MKRAIALLVVGLGACAAGGEGDELPATGGSGGFAATAGGGGLGGSAGSGGTTSTGGSAGSAGSAGTAGAAGSAGSGGACAAVTSCSSPTELGSMSGDSGADTKQVQGTDSEWLHLRVTEDNHSVLGHALEVVVSVDVPADSDIDIYAYLNPDQDSSPCGSSPFVKADSAGIGANEVLDVKWGDGLTGSGSDDSRDLLIEVVHKAGPCTTPWSINLAANP